MISVSLCVNALPTSEKVVEGYLKTTSTTKAIKEKRNYSILDGSLKLFESSSEEILLFKYRLYKSKRANRRLVVLTPNIEGVTVLERRLAHKLAGEGFHVLIPFARLESPKFDSLTSYRIERTFERAMAATLLMIEEVENYIEFEQDQIGLAGASQGGIRSATLYGLDNRFKALFVAVAGADLPSLYAGTEIEQLVSFRDSHMKGTNISSTKDYENYLREHLVLDPSLIVQNPYLDGIALVIANNDQIVPSTNQWKLWETIKEAGHTPKTYVKNVSHVVGALMLVRYENVMVEWFQEKLNTQL
jgi:hypothetical protein